MSTIPPDECLDILDHLQESASDIATAINIMPRGKLDEALEAAAEYVAFSSSLWNLFKDQGLISDSEVPSVYLMERVIDGLYGELAAVTLLLSEPSFGMEKYLDGIIALFDATGKAINAKAADTVPPEVIQGFKSFAARLRNSDVIKKKAAEALRAQKSLDGRPITH